jgi:hypothetical protein
VCSSDLPSGYKNPKGTDSKKAAPIKVSQATIDRIKSAGMAAALKKASGGASAAYVEGVKRMYGATRLKAAMSKTKSAAAGAGSGTSNPKQAGPMMGQPSGYRSTKQAGPANKPSNPRQADNATAKAPVKKAAASKNKPRFGGLSLFADAATGKNKKKKTQEQIRKDNYKYQTGQR